MIAGEGWRVEVADSLRWLAHHRTSRAEGGRLGELFDRGELFDGVVTDPPYSSGGMTRSDRAGPSTRSKYVQTQTERSYHDFEGDSRDQRGFLAWSALWLASAWRVTRRGGVLWVFCDWRQLPTMTDAVQAGGWVWRGVVPWNKGLGTRPHLGRPRSQCEYIVFATKGAHVAYTGAPALPGCLDVQSPRDRIHMTEKPVELLRTLVQAIPPGGVVLDPFMGSGSTLVAALLEGRKAVGVEVVPEIAQLAAERLEGVRLGDRPTRAPGGAALALLDGGRGRGRRRVPGRRRRRAGAVTDHGGRRGEFRELYGSQEWRRLSLEFRRQHPTCAEAGCSRDSKDVDHVTPPRTDAEFWLGPFRALCRPCHSRKTARRDRPTMQQNPTGSDEAGNALVPEAEWIE